MVRASVHEWNEASQTARYPTARIAISQTCMLPGKRETSGVYGHNAFVFTALSFVWWAGVHFEKNTQLNSLGNTNIRLDPNGLLFTFCNLSSCTLRLCFTEKRGTLTYIGTKIVIKKENKKNINQSNIFIWKIPNFLTGQQDASSNSLAFEMIAPFGTIVSTTLSCRL